MGVIFAVCCVISLLFVDGQAQEIDLQTEVNALSTENEQLRRLLWVVDPEIAFYDSISALAEAVPLPPKKERAKYYLSKHLYQEAAWEFCRQGDEAKASAALLILEAILRGPQRGIRQKGSGVSKTYLVDFDHGVQGFFKLEGSDLPLGPVRREVAAYEIDQLLAFCLTPLTIFRDVILPDGTRQFGSLMYFVKNARTAGRAGKKDADKPDILRFFDAVIGNGDRHLGSWMITSTGDVVAIDHNRTFHHDYGNIWRTRVAKINDSSQLGSPFDRYQKFNDGQFIDAIQAWLRTSRVSLFLQTRPLIIAEVESLPSNQKGQ